MAITARAPTVEAHLAGFDVLVARLARSLVARLRRLTVEIDQLDREIAARVEQLTPSLLAVPGCGSLTAAKILGETANIARSFGARAVLVGVRPGVAVTLVELGIDLEHVDTALTLEGALKKLKLKVVADEGVG